jgi:hypothetical protein
MAVLASLTAAHPAFAAFASDPSNINVGDLPKVAAVGQAPLGDDVAFYGLGGFFRLVGGFFWIGVSAANSGGNTGTEPVISSISSSPDGTTVTITWTTDEAATSEVVYGMTASYGSASSSTSLVTSHSITLSGLTAGSTYHYAVISTDSGSNTTTSGDQTFAPAAVICNFQTGVATGNGGGTCVNPLPTCNGNADDTAAFESFANWAINTWQASHSGQIELYIPSGLTCLLTTATVPFSGIKNLLVMGYGASLGSDNTYYHLGSSGEYQDNMHSTRLMAASAGANTIQVNPSAATQPAACNSNATCTALFTVGQWALITGYDLENGIGYPTNPFYFEYVLPTAINSSTGVITLASPLQYSYETTWPNYGTGNFVTPDYGGPATLYVLPASWGSTFEYDGLTFTAGGEWDAVGQNITFRNVTMTYNGLGCFFPTQSYNVAIINSTMTNCTMEADKLNQTLTITGTTISQIGFQSSGSAKYFTLNGSSVVTNLVGTPANTTIANATVSGELIPGPTTYGRADTLVVSNSSIAAIGNQLNVSLGGILYKGPSDDGVNNASGWSMSGGVITIPNSYIEANEGTLGWTAPGTNDCWSDVIYSCAQIFQVTDVTQDATNTYVHTSLSGGFPSWPGLTDLWIRTHPAPSVTFTNVAGSPDAVSLSSAPAGAPLYSYTKRTYTNADTASMPYWTMWGTFEKLNVTVNTPYTGTSTPTDTITPNTLFGNYFNTSNTLVSYVPAIINLKVAGLRTLDATGGYPATWTGAQFGDTLTTLSQALWANTSYRSVTPNISGDPSHPMSVTVQFFTNQGLVIH